MKNYFNHFDDLPSDPKHKKLEKALVIFANTVINFSYLVGIMIFILFLWIAFSGDWVKIILFCIAGILLIGVLYLFYKQSNKLLKEAKEFEKEKNVIKKISNKIKSNRNIQIGLLLILIILIITIYKKNTDRQNWNCLQEITYWDYDSVYSYRDIEFKNQKEALEYCLSDKKFSN